MARGRVQVNDLAKPEKLTVAPVQSDTFAAPPQPQIDNNMERLASALGFFGNKVQSYLDDPTRKKALRDAQLAEWERWKAARTNTDQLDAIRQGKAPYWSDPFIGEVVRRDYGLLEADKLSQDLDSERETGAAPKFGQPTFDPDAYVVQKAKPFLDRVSQDPSSTIAFGDALEKVKEGYKAKHQEALGVTQTQAIENVAFTQLDNVVGKAIEDGVDAQSITTGLKKIYEELGPRVKGGSLDLKYGRLDDILLEVLEKKARDPRYARVAMQMLEADRISADDKTSIGSLKQVARHSDKIAAIQNTAVKTLADEWETSTRATVRDRDVAALASNDGSFATIMDVNVPNEVDKSRSLKINSTARREEAVQVFLEQTKAKNGGKANFDAEFDVLLKNGVKHPEWVPFLQSTVLGLANTNISAGVGPDQLEPIIQAGQLYNKIADRNHTYITSSETGVNKTAQEFFELYTTLTRYSGRTPEQAAIETARAFSSEANAQDPMIVQGRLHDIERAAKNLDFKDWWPGGGAVNTGELSTRIIEIAKATARVEGISADDAIKNAEARLKASTALINGRAVVDPGIQPGDEPWIQTILDEHYKRNPARLAELGMSSGSDLSLASGRNGQYLVVNARGGPPPAVPEYDKDGNITRIRPMVISTAEIQKVRAAGERDLKAKAVEDAVRRNSIKTQIKEQEEAVIKGIRKLIVDPWTVEELKKPEDGR
jgi:hypothetical protein